MVFCVLTCTNLEISRLAKMVFFFFYDGFLALYYIYTHAAVAIKPPSYVLIFYFVFYYVVLYMAAGRSFVFLGAMDPGSVVNFAFLLSLLYPIVPVAGGGCIYFTFSLHFQSFVFVLPHLPLGRKNNDEETVWLAWPDEETQKKITLPGKEWVRIPFTGGGDGFCMVA